MTTIADLQLSSSRRGVSKYNPIRITCLGAVDACDDGGESDCFFGLCGPPEPGCCWSLGESEGSTRTIIAILISLLSHPSI